MSFKSLLQLTLFAQAAKQRGNIASPQSPSGIAPAQQNGPKDVQPCASECTQAATAAATPRAGGRA